MEFINVKLSDIGEVVGGSTPSTKNPDNYDGDIAWITPRDLAGYNKVYISRGERNITEAGFKSCSTKMLPKNSVLFSSRAPIGYVAISEIDLCTNQGFKSIIPNEKIDYKFLYYLLKHNKDYIASKGSGSTFKEVSGSVMKGIELSIPKEISDQRRISKLLFDIDKKIELNNEINNNLFDLGRTYFEEFISNCDEEVAIKDIADEVLDYTKNNNDKVKLLNSSDITENIFPKVEFIDNKDLKGHFKKRFKKYDILYSQIRPRNHHYGYVLLDDSENYLASTRFMVVRNKKEKVSSSLLYYYLTSKNAVEDFTTKTELRSGTFPQGNYEDLSSYVIRYSSNQELITKILDSILETINNNNNENEKLVELRDTLLPKLMNGEIDLDNIEI